MNAALTAVLLAVVAADAPPAHTPPSLAIMPLAARNGIGADVADLLTETLATDTRDRRLFARVVTPREVEAALGIEQKKQLADCESASCAAEIAGALNVTHMLVGSVGRLGTSYLLNLSLVDARTGVALSSAALRVTANTDEALLDALRPAVDKVLLEANLAAPAPAPAAPTSSTEAPVNPGSPPRASGIPRTPLLAAGAVIMASTVVPLGILVLMAGTAAVMGWSMVGTDASATSLRELAGFLPRAAAGYGAVGGAVLGGVLVVVTLVGGAAVVLAGIVVGR